MLAGARARRVVIARLSIATVLALAVSGASPVTAQAAAPLGATGTMLLNPTVPVESGPLEAVPLPELSTETSTTRMLPSGEHEIDIATTPVNYLDENGDWQPIDTDLVAPTADSESPETPAGDYAAENAAAAYTASIPEDAAATPVRMAIDDVTGVPGGEAWAALKMQGLAGQPSIEGDTATFAEVENADAVELQATGEGLKELIILESAPDAMLDTVDGTQGPLQYRYELTTSDGITPRLTETGSIDFTRDSAPGQEPVLSIPVGNMYDSATTVPVEGDPGATTEGPAYTNDVTYDLRRAQATEGKSGWELVVTPDADWLADPAREYPVMIDPSLTTGPVRDCSLFQDNPTASRCGEAQEYLRVGHLAGGNNRRAALAFDVSGLPTAAQIDHANLELWLDPTETSQGNETGYVVQRAGMAFNNSATWRSSGANGAWRGGDPTGAEEGLNRLSGTASDSGWRYFNITPIAEAWHKGPTNGGVANNGVILKQRSETVTNQLAFRSSSAQNPANRRPNLNILYTPAVDAQAGDRGYWDFETRELTDRLTAKTNIGNGNLLLTAQDASVAGVAGWNLEVSRYYNSALAQTGATSNMGAGWSHGFGGSIRLEFPRGSGDRSRLRFWGPTGYRVFFNQVGAGNDYQREEPGINADLRLNANTNRYELKFFDESVYLFDRDGQLQSMRDKNGNALAFAYRAQDNRLASVTDTRGRVADMTYNAGGLITNVAIRRPEGQDGVPGGVMMRFEYTYSQPSGQIAQMTSSRLVSYDNSAAGGTTEDTSVEEGGNIGATTTYTYSANGRMMQVKDARENAMQMSGSGPGGTTQFTYDGNTNRVRKIIRVTDDDDLPNSETTFTYFPNAGIGSSNTCKNQADADATFRTTVNGERDDLAADAQDATRYCVDNHGRVLRTTDARGNVRSTEWTGNSNVDSADMAGTGSGSEQFDYGYDTEDNPNTTTTPEGAATGTAYDDPNRPHSATSTTDDQGNTWNYDYDDRNNVVNARSEKGENQPNVEYRYCWTAEGQIQRIDPVSATGVQAWGTRRENGQCLANGNGQGDDTLFTYNTNDELIDVNRPAGGDQSFVYDNLSRIKSVTDARGVTTTLTYDALDRVVRSVYSTAGQMGQTVEWEHDLAGNLTELRNDSGSNEFGYDELNRKDSENEQDPSGATEFTYDAASNVRVVTVGGEPNPTRYTYDNLNRVVSLTDQRGGQAVTRFEYDQRDNRTRTVFPILQTDGQSAGNNLIQKTSYDGDGKVKCVFSFRQANAPSVDLDPVSRACPDSNFDGLITYRGYDYDNDSGDRTSTKQAMTEIGNRRTEFAYDSINRLVSAITGPDSDPLRAFEYGYDRHSNLIDQGVQGRALGLQTGRLQVAHNVGDQICASVRQGGTAPNLDCDPSTTVPGQTNYQHDAAGNLLNATGGGVDSLSGLELTYNLPGQTSSMTAPGATDPTPQSYDGVMQDRRTQSGDTSMSYGFSGLSAQETTGSRPASQIFVRDPAGSLIAMLTRDPASGEITESDYYLADDQQTILATHDGSGLLDGDGLIRYQYEPYGKIIRTWTHPAAGTVSGDGAQDRDLSAPISDANPFNYVSGYLDRASGLVKFGARYYIPELATWTQADPENGKFDNPLSLNRYQYGYGNPIENVDNTGRDADVSDLIVGCLSGAVTDVLFSNAFALVTGPAGQIAAAARGCLGGLVTTYGEEEVGLLAANYLRGILDADTAVDVTRAILAVL